MNDDTSSAVPTETRRLAAIMFTDIVGFSPIHGALYVARRLIAGRSNEIRRVACAVRTISLHAMIPVRMAHATDCFCPPFPHLSIFPFILSRLPFSPFPRFAPCPMYKQGLALVD